MQTRHGTRPALRREKSCVPPGSSRAASCWPELAASDDAVSPKWLATAGLAPAASSARMMWRWPFSHAFMSAVVPCFVCELTGMPRESACSTSSSWPASAASISPDA